MKLEMETVNYDGNSVILCPECGESYLHHYSVDVIFRDWEDQDGTVVESTRKGVKVSRKKSEHILGRRDDIIIRFWCESKCKNLPLLHITQHKGQTFLEWLDKDGKEI